ncbi:MAG TPA: alpha/beta hydrolase-fold protein [Anaerolineaceae bacterium]|nr:alpha/beta hydrolase-fold protein [Anaerolineaceae bacterium]
MKSSYSGIVLLAFLLLSGCQPTIPPAPAAQINPTQSSFPFKTSAGTLQTPSVTPTQLPSPTLIPTPAGCQDQHGSIERQSINSKLLAKSLFFQLYLPPCYDAKKTNGYPLLILMHGQTFNDDQWVRLGVPASADTLILSEKTPPFIVAMPYEEYWLSNPYISKFGQSVVEELIPWLDANFNTCAKKECRAIGGLSRGAAWAMHLGLTYWSIFGAIGAHSLVPFTGDPGFLPLWLKKIPSGQIPAIYMDMGDKDVYFKFANNWDKLLTYYQVPHEFHINSGRHEEPYWQAHVTDYLIWYASHWQK